MVLEHLGGGGRGEVYAAYDPERDRKVALKLLLTDQYAFGRTVQGQSLCLREAQILARLSHPQVIPVYEVGILADHVYIAMEFIEGSKLTDWLSRQPRSQREIVEVFIKAGHGLAAAHAAGILHANFKPNNVLIGNDGRVCVTDLGLSSSPVSELASVVPAQIEFDFRRLRGYKYDELDSLTRDPRISRSHGHIAPELHRDKPIELRTDIYTFCAALYEALYHMAPGLVATGEQKTAGGTDASQRGHVAARPYANWLQKALIRGLHPEPSKRYSNMNALLSTLSRRRQQRRWWLVGGSTAILLSGLALLGWYISILAKRQQQLCSGAATKLATAWNADRKGALHEALLHTGKPYAEETWHRVEKALDHYGAQWIAMHTEACQSTRIRGEQSEALLDLRMQCLDRRLTDLTALTQLLVRVEPTWLDKVTKAAQELTPVGICADSIALTAQIPPPEAPAKRSRLAGMVSKLSEVAAMARLGQYVPAQEAAQALVQAAHELGYAPFEAETLYWLGFIQYHRGQSKAAAETMMRAASTGVAGLDLRIAAKAWTRLVSINGFNLAQPEEARKWEQLASAAISTLGDNAEARFDLASARCVAAYADLAADRTLALCQESLDAAIKIFGPSHYHVPAQMNNLADVLSARQQNEQAIRFYRQALQITQQQLGDSHPSVAIHLNNLGEALGSIGKYREAISALTQAVELQKRILEPEHPERGVILATLGALLWDDGQIGKASSTLKESIEILEKGFPPGHPQLRSTQLRLVHVLLAQQSNQEAQKLAERLLSASELAPLDAAELHYLLGQSWARQQRYEEALVHHKQALVMHDKAMSEVGKMQDLAALGTDLIQLDRAKEALPLLEQAVQQGLTVEIPADVRAQSQFALAQALWKLNSSATNERIVTLLAAARSYFVHAGSKYIVEKNEIERWLAAQHVALPTTGVMQP